MGKITRKHKLVPATFFLAKQQQQKQQEDEKKFFVHLCLCIEIKWNEINK